MAGLLWSSAEGAHKVFETTDNLAGTTLNNGGNVAAGYVGLVTLTASAAFPSSGYVQIENEIIAYNKTGAGANQINLVTRGALDTTDALHLDGLAVGEVYVSVVIGQDGYSQVCTKISCDQNCSMTFTWFADRAATLRIRQLAPTFASSSTYDFLSSVSFGPYSRYTIAPSTGSSTTRLYYATELHQTALSPQLITLATAPLDGMVSQLGRSIITGYDGTGYANVTLTDKRELLTNTYASTRAVTATYENAAVAATTYVLLVDASNTGGEWPHTATTTGLCLDAYSASVDFATGTASAVVRLGVITRIDGTDADISYIVSTRLGVQNANDSVTVYENYQPACILFDPDAGTPVGSITNAKDSAVVAINTGAAIPSPAGTTVPGLGDIILKLEYVADTYAANVRVVYHTPA